MDLDSLKQATNLATGFDNGFFTPSRTTVDPEIPYLALSPAGDPDPTGSQYAVITWLEIQEAPVGAIPPQFLRRRPATTLAILMRF